MHGRTLKWIGLTGLGGSVVLIASGCTGFALSSVYLTLVSALLPLLGA
jgi:hypothetical protein